MYYNSFFLVLTIEAVGVSAKSMLAAVCKTFYWANYFLQTKSFVSVQGTSFLWPGFQLLYISIHCSSLRRLEIGFTFYKHNEA